MIIPVHTKESTYSVYLGSNTLKEFCDRNQQALRNYDQLIVVTDEHVWSRHQEYFEASFHLPYKLYLAPNGEACKTFESFFDVQSFLLTEGCSRNSAILALGGGAIGDLTGFVAATFMRGIAFYQLPTTILAHDSAVGGKTAINHPLGKNMIGAFYQPKEVVYDIHFLQTLPPHEILSGMAEVIKHAYISDEKWVEEFLLLKSMPKLDSKELVEWLGKGIQVKANIVSQDEKEGSVRKYLNFGHTYGHAVEASIGYGKITHGEAVMIGMVPALLLSEKHGNLKSSEAFRLFDWASKAGYDFSKIKDISFEQIAAFMLKDKKTTNKELHFVLLESIGKPFMKKISMEEIHQADLTLRNWIGGKMDD